MRIAILHEELEWAERQFHKILTEMGIRTHLFDIRDTTFKDLKDFDLVMNRVYASVANRNYSAIKRTLLILRQLEEEGITCVNSLSTSIADYDKKYALGLRSAAGFFTPKTTFLSTEDEAFRFAKDIGFPLILKRNTGGRGKDIFFIKDKEQLNVSIRKIKSADDQYTKAGGRYILQEFLKPTKQHDFRIGVLNNKVILGYGRTLISHDGKTEPWLASVTNGSKIIELDNIPPDVKEVALNGTKLINAIYNELDIIQTKDGPVIIEDNPTPNYICDPKRPHITEGEIQSIKNVIKNLLDCIGYVGEKKNGKISCVCR